MINDYFRNPLDQMIDLRHPLAMIANFMPWQKIEASLLILPLLQWRPNHQFCAKPNFVFGS